MDESNRRVQRMQIIGEEEEDDGGEAGPSRGNPDSIPRRRSNPVEAFRRALRINRNPLRINRHRSEDGLISSQRDQSSEDSNTDNETSSENAERFDTELPPEHSYLGNMNRVTGIGYLEEQLTYRLLIFVHHSLVFPGETLPMIIPDHLFDPTNFMDEALLFGVVFPSIWKTTKPKIYGVTCKVYEKRSDEHGNIIVKSRVHQRFVITKEYNKNFSELLESHQRKVYARVKILPEILLPDPLAAIDLGSMNRFRDISSMEDKLRNISASTTIWPKFVFDKYRISSIVERTKQYLFNYKIESMPTDYTQLSFWFARNLIFNPADRTKLFVTNSVNIRMQIVEDSLDYDRFFCCRRCRNQIANCNTLFAMSKHGVQTNYCNPGGIIHETNTVYAVRTDAVYPSGAPSTQFSWFPGYSWQVLLCRICDIHIGWRFDSTKPNLIPQNFYALSGLNIVVDLNNEGEQSTYNNESGGESMHEDYVLVYPLQDDFIE